jgi:hypothetical protein
MTQLTYVRATPENCQTGHYPHCCHCIHTDKLGACAWPYDVEVEIAAGRAPPWQSDNPEDRAWFLGRRGGGTEGFHIIPLRVVLTDEQQKKQEGIA